MRYAGDEATYILGSFVTGDTVTIDIYDLSDDSLDVDDGACSEIASTGIFKYSFNPDVGAKQYAWIMSNGSWDQRGKMVFGGYLDDVLDDTDELVTDDVPGLIAGLNDPTAATVADAVWDEASAGHVSAGKAGEQLWTDIDGVKAMTDNLPDSGALNDLATILTDTDELQADWTDGGRLDLLLDAVKAVTDNLPDSGALNDLAAILADTGTAGVVIATATAQAIANDVLKRGVGNVDDTADATSLAALVLAAFDSVIDEATSTWTIYKTDHETTFTTRTVTTDPDAEGIIEVT